MSYLLTEHEAKTIAAALACIETVANQRQARLNQKARMIREVAPGMLGVLLTEGRTIDTLERVCSDLAGILNRPRVEPDPIPPSQQEA